MPKRNWVIVAALGLVLTSAFAAWAAWSLAEYQKQHAEQRQGISSYEAETADEYLRICRERSGVSVAATIECLANSAQANRQTQAAEYDLTAQQDMAEWAFALLLVSLFGLVISISGLVALFISLAQTRTAITNSREIGEAQTRAYLHCSSAKYTLAKNSISVTVELENTGQSPASQVEISGTALLHLVGGLPSMPRVLAWKESSRTYAVCQPIVAGGKMLESLHFFDFSFADDADEDAIPFGSFSDWNEVNFDIEVEWHDVFRQEQRFSIELHSAIGSSPNNPTKRRTRTGNLTIRAGDSLLRGEIPVDYRKR